MTLGSRKKNYLESYHSKIKQFTRTCNTLSNCFIKVYNYLGTKEDRSREETLRQWIKVTYDTRHNHPTSTAIWFHAKPVRAKQMLEERQRANRWKKNLVCTAVEGNAHTVTYKGHANTITFGDSSFECTCYTWQNKRVFCPHAFHCLDKHDMVFTKEGILPKFRINRSEETAEPSLPTPKKTHVGRSPEEHEARGKED